MAECLDRFTELDARIVEATRSIKILSTIAWNEAHRAQFIDAWRAGRVTLPVVEERRLDLSREKEALRAVILKCDRDHPVGRYLADTAESFVDAAVMLENTGDPVFTELSRKLYGGPRDPIIRELGTTVEAAIHLLETTEEYMSSSLVEDPVYSLRPEAVAEELTAIIQRTFPGRRIDVVIDGKLASKAAAGSSRVRIRGSTPYTRADVSQLLQHELLVHTLTAINGREQPHLKTMGLGAPRTTRTQEGLAIFAEMITNSMDLHRLRRIAARVVATDMALSGADFVEVFRFFLECGQTDMESFNSSMRIFRGGCVRGRIAFTKDVVYLQGFVRVHDFLRRAIHSGRLEYAHYLFAGRVWTRDIEALAPYFESGYIARPTYEPEWVMRRSTLAAFVLYSDFTTKLHLGQLAAVPVAARAAIRAGGARGR